MNEWEKVAVLAEAMQQQFEAALVDYGPIQDDPLARAYVAQASLAIGNLAKHANTKVSDGITGTPTAGDIRKVLEILAGVAGVSPDVFEFATRARTYTNARSAIAWMLYYGVAFAAPVTWTLLAEAVGVKNHTSLICAVKRADAMSGMVAQMYDELERRGIKTHPRPDWAKEAA
jgi:hypothetical protein